MKAHLLWSSGQKHIKNTNKNHPKVVLQQTHNAGAKMKGMSSNTFIKADSQNKQKEGWLFRGEMSNRGYQDKAK